jgi:recombinase-like zinc beta ribbon protein/recombinase
VLFGGHIKSNAVSKKLERYCARRGARGRELEVRSIASATAYLRLERKNHCARVERPENPRARRGLEQKGLSAQSQRTDGEWVRSAIIGDVRRGTGILKNPIYRGEVVWGRSRWVRSPRDSAIRRCEPAEQPDELITRHDERLRIVSDDLWNTVHIVQSARTPRSEAIREAKRRKGRGPALWLSSLLVCSECGSNYVQYGRTDYICSGFHNGSTCKNGMRFRIAEIEKAVLEKLELDCLSPDALNRAADLAMEYLKKQQTAEPPAPPELSAAQADIDARESDIREQFKTGKLPSAVFKTWIAEFARERESLNRRRTAGTAQPARVTRADFLQEYRSAVARKLKIFTARENVAQSREALRTVLAEGRLILRPDVANARFEGSLVLSHEEFFEQKQIDIKLVAGGRYELYSTYPLRMPAVPASVIATE